MKTTSTALCGLVTALLSITILPHAHALAPAVRGGVNMEFVDIGHVGNTGDTAVAGYGAVNYAYSIGKYEVTSTQWAAALSSAPNIDPGPFPNPWNGSQPTARVSWHEAAQFTNWLTSGNALQGAYQFSNATTFTGVNRALALTIYDVVYVLPTEDEWYKAAYFKSDGSGYTTYTTGDTTPDGIDSSGDTSYDSVMNDGFSNGAPLAVGGGTEENNGTYDMGGNVWEVTESASDGTLDDPTELRVSRGGAWFNDADILKSSYRGSIHPFLGESSSIATGFRVAAVERQLVPEPSSLGLLVIGAVGCVLRRKRG